MSSSAKVVIVGGGVNGFSCGVSILQSIPNVEVTIIAKELSPNTIGDKAAGLCFPFAISGTSTDLIIKWFRATYELCGRLARTGEAATAGIYLQSGFHFGEDTLKYKDEFLTYQVISEAQMKHIMPSIKSSAALITTYIIEGRLFLAWLTKKFSGLGGKVEMRKVDSFSELSNEYDVIVNCAGLGAGELARDSEVFPVRGQVIKVKAPFIQNFFIDMSKVSYIIPTSNIVTVGGTIQKGNFDRNVDMKTKKQIMTDACLMVPNLKNCEVVEDWVGLRPGRSSLRLEKELFTCGRKTIPIIHNYGHGGSGLSLAWGCAKDVVSLITKERHFKDLSSKL